MSLECAECERDLRGGHDRACSRYIDACCVACRDHVDDHDEEGACLRCPCLMRVR